MVFGITVPLIIIVCVIILMYFGIRFVFNTIVIGIMLTVTYYLIVSFIGGLI